MLCPRLTVIPEAVPQSSRPDCSVSSERPDWGKHLETSRYLRQEEFEQVRPEGTRTHSIRGGSTSTYVVPLLAVGVGAAMAVGTTPSKPDEVKARNQTLMQQPH